MIQILGKNGSGKTFIANELYKQGFQRSVSYTTRPKRDGETDGIEYNFISRDEFEEKIASGEFVEYKFKNDNYYGILRSSLSENSIIISGDSKKIEEATGLSIKKVYISCDMTTRFKRVLNRHEPIINTFDRFHSENYSYLYDFDAFFIDNADTPIQEALDQFAVLSKQDSNLPIKSNRTFIREEIEKLNIEKVTSIGNKLLALLIYEEYLLRMLFLNNKALNNDIIISGYYNEMIKFAKSIGLNCEYTNSGLIIKINNQDYNFDFLEKRLVLR